MKKAKWAALGISLLIAVSPPANGQTATSAFNPSDGVVYIIRNVETGQFLRCSDAKDLFDHAAYFTDSIDSDYHLWTFKKSGNGWLMYNNGKEGYLTDIPTSSTYLGKTSSEGTEWYISDYSFKKANNNDYKKGYIISSSASVPTTHCLYAYKDESPLTDHTYYLCTTDADALTTNSLTEDVKTYYQLPTFQFYSYDDLYKLVKSRGYAVSEKSNPGLSDWKTLVRYLTTTVNTDTVASSYTSKGDNIVIASRRYHKFLSVDNKGVFHSADKITTSSIFLAQPQANGVRVFSNVYHGDGGTFKIYYAYNGHNNDFKLKRGDSFLCIDNSGQIYEKNLNPTSNKAVKSQDLATLDDEWVIANTPYDIDNLQYLSINKTDIRDVKDWYFRIENKVKRIKLIDATGDATGGYLNDVDTTALRQFDDVKKTSIHSADVFSNSINIRDASNIWHITLAFKGKDDANNAPIGIVSTFSNSLYYIQNANTGKYLGDPAGKSQLMPLISKDADRSERALIYFVPKDKDNDTGEYAMVLFNKTDESAKGYLDIDDTNSDGTPKDTTAYNQAGLIFKSCNADATGLPDDAYYWKMHRARFITARTADSKKFLGNRYVTIWFPFDVTATDDSVKLYMAVWNATSSGITFKKIDWLPANHGALVLAPDNNKYKEIKFSIGRPAMSDEPENIGKDILLGVAEGEDYRLGDNDDLAGGIHSRDSIYVFSVTKAEGYTDTDLALGHPADNFLMANRCYVKATKASEAYLRGSQSKTFTFSVDTGEDNGATTGIREINTSMTADTRYYDLQGREVIHPQHGIYITNGKKIYIK